MPTASGINASGSFSMKKSSTWPRTTLVRTSVGDETDSGSLAQSQSLFSFLRLPWNSFGTRLSSGRKSLETNIQTIRFPRKVDLSEEVLASRRTWTGEPDLDAALEFPSQDTCLDSLTLKVRVVLEADIDLSNEQASIYIVISYDVLGDRRAYPSRAMKTANAVMFADVKKDREESGEEFQADCEKILEKLNDNLTSHKRITLPTCIPAAEEREDLIRRMRALIEPLDWSDNHEGARQTLQERVDAERRSTKKRKEDVKQREERKKERELRAKQATGKQEGDGEE